MRKFGLIGNPVYHSFSKKYFEEKFRRESIAHCSYNLYQLTAVSDFPDLLTQHPELKGLNVTIPFKRDIINYLNSFDEIVTETGSCNCIKIIAGQYLGYNTDVFGVEETFKLLLEKDPYSAFVLGNGGSAQSVKYVLKQKGIGFFSVSRTPSETEISYAEIESLMSESNLFINTTPLGMFPDFTTFPDIPYHRLKETDILFDLVYNPEETEFLKRGKQAGCKTTNGLPMLIAQAEKSWEIWNQ